MHQAHVRRRRLSRGHRISASTRRDPDTIGLDVDHAARAETQYGAAFEFFVRKLPPTRNFFLAAGLEQVLDYLEQVRFTDADIAWLRSLDRFSDGFLDRLRSFRFTGDVDALPEGTVFFPDEPVLRVAAPLPSNRMLADVLTLEGQSSEGLPLMQPVMRAGKRIAGRVPITEARQRASSSVAQLPESLRGLTTGPALTVQVALAFAISQTRWMHTSSRSARGASLDNS